MKYILKIVTFIVFSISSVAIYANEVAGETLTGTLCGVKHTPDSSSALWSIHRYDFEQQTSELVFGVQKNRKIQSVACRNSTDPVLFSMRETQGGDYEIYEYDPSRSEPLKQLTHNDTDDVDVSVSADGYTMVYQKRLDDGRQALSITYSDEYYQYPEKTLASASPFVQPTLSENGRWLVFVQLRTSYFALMRYDILQNKYTEVRRIPRRKRLFHPSISNNGNMVGWSENRKQNRYLVKDISTGVVAQIVNDASGIEHGMLSSDGKMLVYSINNASESNAFITNLNTLETAQIGESGSAPSRYLSAAWQGGLYTDSDGTSTYEATFSLVNSTLKAKDKIYPDSTSITLMFNQEVDSDTIAEGIYIKKTSTGEIFAAGSSRSQLSWSHPREYVRVTPATPEESVTVVNEDGSSTTTSSTTGRICRRGGDGCVEVIDKTIVNLSLSTSDLDKGTYTLHIASDLVTNELGLSFEPSVEIPFSILKPQSFSVEILRTRASTAENKSDEVSFRVYNENTATKLHYKTELSNGQTTENSLDIGSADTATGGASVGYQICTLAVVTKIVSTSNSYYEGEKNYQILSVIMTNDTNADFNGSLNVELCSDSGDCKMFDFDMNVSADPDFDPDSPLPLCQALVN